MTNPNTMSNTNQLPDFSKMNKDELMKWFQNASQQKDLDLAAKYIDALKNVDTKYSTLDQADTNKMTKAQLREFVKRQIGEIRSSTDEASKSKEEEMIRLLEQLQDEKASNHRILTDTPSLKEYYSLKRRRNANLLKTIDKLKEEPDYPKNVLIYAMGITSSKYFGAGQALKRWWAKLTRNWKAENIKDNIENLLQRCQPEAGDSDWKKAIKENILQAVRDAKDAYNRKFQLQNTF